MSKRPLPAHAVLLAGGRGTRFWPRSRMRTPKQLLNIVGDETMLAASLRRLRPAFPVSRLWVVTNADQVAEVRRQAPYLDPGRILAEPVGRNTAAAIGLAAIHVARQSDDALMAVLPADHYIGQPARYLRLVRAALEIARRGPNLVVLGIPPTRPETGYGYIARARLAARAGGFPVYTVRRFTEKPSLGRARRYLASGRYFWNAGMFFWRVSTFLDNLRRFLPATYNALMRLADDIGTPRYAKRLRHIYPQLENISVDYAVMEPASQEARRSKKSNLFVVPAEMSWSDLGSWAAVYEMLARQAGENVSAGPFLALDARGNYLWSPKKFVAAVGVHDLVVVETADALLVCSRDRAQDVGRVVRWLEQHRQLALL